MKIKEGESFIRAPVTTAAQEKACVIHATYGLCYIKSYKSSWHRTFSENDRRSYPSSVCEDAGFGGMGRELGETFPVPFSLKCCFEVIC